MVGPSDDKMKIDDQPSRPTELKLKQPASFTGKQDELDDFIQDILLCLGVNDGIYDSDRKKIGYNLYCQTQGRL